MSEKHKRIAYFDNLKGILIALVVLGHVISPVIASNPYANLLHHVIYLFHMPLFVFTTGLFSASVFSSGTLKVERIFSYTLLALGLQLFAVLPFHSLEELLSNLFIFNSAAWYLFSCAIWFALTPLVDRMKPIPALVTSVCISLIAGGLPQLGDFLALSRTLVFLPWFVGGRLTRPERVQNFIRRRRLSTPLAIGGILALTAYVFLHDAVEPAFYLAYGALPYQGSFLVGVAGRLGFTAAALLISCTLLSITSDKPIPLLSIPGTRTLEIFVVHRFVRMGLRFMGFYGIPAIELSPEGLAFLILASCAVTWLSALPIWTRPIQAVAHLRWRAFLEQQ